MSNGQDWTFWKLAAANGFLYTLATPAPNQANAILLRTGPSGKTDLLAKLGPREVQDFCVDRNGGIYVLYLAGIGRAEVSKYSARGNLESTWQPSTDFYKLSCGGIGIYGLDANGSAWNLQPPHERIDFGPISPKLLSQTRIVELDDQSFALVDAIGAEISILNTKSKERTSSRMKHPEIDRIRADYSTDRSVRAGERTGVTVLDATAWKGQVYCALGNFKPKDGMPVLVIDPHTGHTDLFRIPMTRHSGYQPLPKAIAVDGGRVFFIDTHGTVSVYALK